MSETEAKKKSSAEGLDDEESNRQRNEWAAKSSGFRSSSSAFTAFGVIRSSGCLRTAMDGTA